MRNNKIKIKPLKAYAIVKTTNPKLKVSEIYDTKDICIEKGEKIIEVIITVKN